MNNVKIDGTKIMLDKERKLIFDLNALCELEETYGNLDKVLERLSPTKGLPSMKDIRYIFYLGLKEDDETLTEKEVGKLITLDNVYDIIDTLGVAMMGTLPEVEEGEGKNE